MLFLERTLRAIKALPEGCFWHTCHQSVNAYRVSALISIIKFKQNTSLPSRSTNRHHLARTLSNNRRTLSPKQRGKCIQNCFTKSFTLQNQENCAHVGSQIHLYIDQFLRELAIKTIKIKCGSPPKSATMRLGGLFTTL